MREVGPTREIIYVGITGTYVMAMEMEWKGVRYIDFGLPRCIKVSALGSIALGSEAAKNPRLENNER